MKRVKLIYNPVSGDGTFKDQLDLVVEIFQEKGYFVDIYRTNKNNSIEEFLRQPLDENNTIIVGVGGDGTINKIVNIMMKNNIKVPLGIIPKGTANDLASFLNIPKNTAECCEMIAEHHLAKIDVGKINNDYFISVVSGGLMASIPHVTDIRMKNTLGKLAYYLKGLEEIPNFNPISIAIESPDYMFKGEVFLYLVLNSRFAGGFKKIAPNAEVNDGKFDVILFKKTNLSILAKLFIKLLRGEHINDPNIIFFQTKELSIKSYLHIEENLLTDIDGEEGPNLPASIQNIHNALDIIIPKEIRGGFKTI